MMFMICIPVIPDPHQRIQTVGMGILLWPRHQDYL